jgi:hypothetical protein
MVTEAPVDFGYDVCWFECSNAVASIRQFY